MKRKNILIATSIWLLAALLLCSCDILGTADSRQGELRISFAGESGVYTRTQGEIPDTSDFILKVTDSKGAVVYDGLYGAAPESIKVSAGTYTVSALSCEFTKPAFSAPQFGDEQCVVVKSGGVVQVRLVCTQKNSGIRLRTDPAFLTAYPDGVLMLKSAEGKLVYGYSEKRVAYFKPGKVSLVLSSEGQDEILTTRVLGENEILTMKVGVSSSASSRPCDRISIALDTNRIWLTDSYVIGGSDASKGTSPENALTVSQAMASAGLENVWVCGYIVGGDLTSSSASFEEPFTSRTNMLLGPKSGTVSRESCIAVQLPSGSVRDRMNLVDNPSLIGSKVCLKGDLTASYFGLIGLKNVDEYEML